MLTIIPPGAAHKINTLAGGLEKVPIPWIDQFFVLAHLAFILVVTVVVSRYGPHRSLPFAGQTIQLVEPVAVLPAFILYEGVTSCFIWWKKPLASGQAGWFLVLTLIFATLSYAITGGIGSMYFYLLVLVTIYATLALKTGAAALFILGIAVAHLLLGLTLIPAADWDAVIARVAFGESTVLLVLGGITLFFSAQIRRDARGYQRALVEAQHSALLNQVGRQLAEQSLDLARVLAVLLEATHLLPQSEFALVLLLDPPAPPLRVVASTTAWHPVGEAVPDLAWLAPLRCVTGTGAGYATPVPPFFGHDAVRQIIILPLTLPSGDVLGAISLGRQSDQPLTAEEQGLVQTLATEAGLAVRNARLYAQEVDQVERLRRFQELQTTYFAALAHEIKTPLTVLRTLLPAVRQWPALADETRREMLEAIDGNLARLEWSINGSLEGAQLEAGVLVLHPHPLQLASAVRQVVARIAPWLDLKRQRVSVSAAPDLPLALADASQLEHVLTNLLVNAIKYAPAASTIAVELQPVAQVMQVCVVDEGPGVPPAERERIFDKFHSAAAAQATGGVGLGLYICRELVHKHGGRIWVEERPGGGSRFCFTLPLAHEEGQDEEG
jgi:K+-sensing histidine kinase KdpD